MDTETTVASLVDLHGEQGLSHSADGWRRILEIGSDRPIRVLNMLKFYDRVVIEEEQMGGRTAYLRYLAATAGPFERVGGR